MSRAEVSPARGPGAPLPNELGGSAVLVMRWVDVEGWVAECFVEGASVEGARDAAADWLALDRAVLLATKVGGSSGDLSVVEVDPPPPPQRQAREFDPDEDLPG